MLQCSIDLCHISKSKPKPLKESENDGLSDSSGKTSIDPEQKWLYRRLLVFLTRLVFRGPCWFAKGTIPMGSVMGFTKSPSSASAFTQFRDAPASMMVSSLITSVKVGQERGEENGVEKTKGVIHVSIWLMYTTTYVFYTMCVYVNIYIYVYIYIYHMICFYISSPNSWVSTKQLCHSQLNPSQNRNKQHARTLCQVSCHSLRNKQQKSTARWFFVPFLGWLSVLSDPFKG